LVFLLFAFIVRSPYLREKDYTGRARIKSGGDGVQSIEQGHPPNGWVRKRPATEVKVFLNRHPRQQRREVCRWETCLMKGILPNGFILDMKFKKMQRFFCS
jgi:hypothetical protein